ncbi:hypothetical protein DXA36_04785 [Eisenbergiella sp. OF01-20]|nr:hypothetical protein DXA36_04785 [Eisenbergiella sp. OF01-20]BDF43435.1 hypothetical protein CE91St56_05580 [Lachnospiraceae bacterium]GKH39585.1 hypothetical protein CE91St57_05590 [Lachnospiraceae bacterium]
MGQLAGDMEKCYTGISYRFTALYSFSGSRRGQAGLLLTTVCGSDIDSSGTGNKGMEEDCGTGRSKGYRAGHVELLEKK